MRNSYLIQPHVSGDVRDRERFLVQLFMSGMRSASTRDHKRREIKCDCTPSDLGSGDHGCTNLTGLVVGGCAVCKGTNWCCLDGRVRSCPDFKSAALLCSTHFHWLPVMPWSTASCNIFAAPSAMSLFRPSSHKASIQSVRRLLARLSVSTKRPGSTDNSYLSNRKLLDLHLCVSQK